MMYLTKKMKRMLCLLLCFSMIFAYVQIPAHAAEAVRDMGLCEHHTEHTTECGYAAAYADGDVASVTANGTPTPYTDIQSAVDAAENQSGSTLTLLDDVTLADTTTITIDSGTFTFDLAGHTLTFAETTTNTAIKVSGGSVTFTDSGGSGSVVVPGTYTYSRAMVISGGMVTINGGSYTARNAIDISEGAALTVNDGTITAASDYGTGISNYGTLNIHGGSINTIAEDGWGRAIYLPNSCTATITGGTITSGINTSGIGENRRVKRNCF